MQKIDPITQMSKTQSVPSIDGLLELQRAYADADIPNLMPNIIIPTQNTTECAIEKHKLMINLKARIALEKRIQMDNIRNKIVRFNLKKNKTNRHKINIHYDRKLHIKYIRNQNTDIKLPSKKNCSCISYVLGKKCPYSDQCRYGHIALLSELGFSPINWYKKIVRNEYDNIEIYHSRHQNGMYWFNFDKNLNIKKVYKTDKYHHKLYLDASQFLRDIDLGKLNPNEVI